MNSHHAEASQSALPTICAYQKLTVIVIFSEPLNLFQIEISDRNGSAESRHVRAVLPKDVGRRDVAGAYLRFIGHLVERSRAGRARLSGDRITRARCRIGGVECLRRSGALGG